MSHKGFIQGLDFSIESISYQNIRRSLSLPVKSESYQLKKEFIGSIPTQNKIP